MTNWDSVSLSEVLIPIERSETPISGKLYRQLGVRLWGEGAYERDPLDGSETKYKTLSQVKLNDIVVNKIWARNGSVAIVPAELDGCYVSGEFPTFVVNPDKILPEWIHWLTKTPLFWNKCEEKSKGTSGKNRINKDNFLKIEIPLPELNEQRKINNSISKLSNKINVVKKIRKQTISESSNLFFKRLATIMMPKSGEWVHETVNDVITSIDAGWSPVTDNIPAIKDQWGVLKTTSVQWCEFRPQENKRLPPNIIPDSKYLIRKGDVLVTRAGPRKRVGVVAAVNKDEPNLTVSDKTIRLRTNPDKINYRFLELALASPYSQEFLMHRKTGLADAQVNISQSILKATPIAYPSSLPEQERIIKHLEVFKMKLVKLTRLHEQTSIEIDAFVPSILDKAFKGEL